MSIQKNTVREERRESSFSSQTLIAKLSQTSFLASTSGTIYLTMPSCIRKGRVITLMNGKDNPMVYKIFREHYLNFIFQCRTNTQHLRSSDLFPGIGKNKSSIFFLRK